MDIYSFLLESKSVFHFGDPKVGLESVLDHAPSDTLFSALCVMMIQTHGIDAFLGRWMNAFSLGQPPFLCTGAFPYLRVNKEEVIRFYPAPLSWQREFIQNLKEVQWISASIFEEWRKNPQTLSRLLADTNLSEKPKVLLRPSEIARLPKDPRTQKPLLWKIDLRTRVSVDRITNRSNVFQVGKLVLPKGGGLWCGFAVTEEHMVDELRFLLEVLGDSGFGGERSSGYGRFVPIDHQYEQLPYPDAGKQFITLSHYAPQPTELGVLRHPDTNFRWIPRRGFMYTSAQQTLPRQQVNMIATGSVLVAEKDTVYGQLVDVTPIDAQGNRLVPFRVNRYGYAFPIALG